jgi:hypothetical protein
MINSHELHISFKYLIDFIFLLTYLWEEGSKQFDLHAKHVKRTILHMYCLVLNAIKLHYNFISDHLPEKQKFESYYSIDAPIIHKCNNIQQLFSYASISININNIGRLVHGNIEPNGNQFVIFGLKKLN